MVAMNPTQNHQAWLDVAMFENLEAGKALVGFLRDKRLEARTYDDKLFRYFLFLRPPRVTYRVQVRKGQFKFATELVRSSPPAAILDQALHCPACGSFRVNYPQMTRQFVLPTVLLHLGIIFHIIEHECYCENCHEMWNLPGGRADIVKPHAVKPIAF
jgi:hypothetical protein